MMVEDQTTMVLAREAEREANASAVVAGAAGSAPGGQAHSVVKQEAGSARLTQASCWSPSSESSASWSSQATLADVSKSSIEPSLEPNTTATETSRPQVATSGEQSVADGLSLTLSAEEESQLKSSIYSNDDTDSNGPKTNHQRSASSGSADQAATAAPATDQQQPCGDNSECLKEPGPSNKQTIELRLLVRRREAGALIGKRGTNIKRLREKFRNSVISIPDTGNGPERIVCLTTDEQSMQPILDDLSQCLVEKSPENDEQIELKLLIHSSQAGSLIGIGGQSIKKLRNDSRAAIKIYELCCPLSNERVCAIKARPPVVVHTMKLIQTILNENPIRGTMKPYDALHFDLVLAEKYGGFLPDDGPEVSMPSHHHNPHYPFPQLHHRSRGPMAPAYARQYSHAASFAAKQHYPLWRSADPLLERQHLLDMNEEMVYHLKQQSHHQAMQQSLAAQLQQQHQGCQVAAAASTSPSASPQLQPNQQYGSHLYQTSHYRQHHHHQHRIKREPLVMGCNEPKLAAKLCPPGALTAPTRPANYHHLSIRFHPYAIQAPPGSAPYPACVRPSLRHHHHGHHQSIMGDHVDQVYAPEAAAAAAAAILYGHHNPIDTTEQLGEFSRMQAFFGESPQPADGCRHMKPCSCVLVPVAESAPRQIYRSVGPQTGAPATQIDHIPTTSSFVPHLKDPPSTSSNGFTEIDTTKSNNDKL